VDIVVLLRLGHPRIDRSAMLDDISTTVVRQGVVGRR